MADLQDRNLVTILAALRLWQSFIEKNVPEAQTTEEMLDAEQIDELCENLNRSQHILLEFSNDSLKRISTDCPIEIVAFIQRDLYPLSGPYKGFKPEDTISSVMDVAYDPPAVDEHQQRHPRNDG